MSLGKRIRGGLAALLSASLIVSGALLTAPAASAEELAPVDAVAEVVEEPAATPEPVAQEPAAETPAAEPAPEAEAPAEEASDQAATVQSFAPSLLEVAAVAEATTEVTAASETGFTVKTNATSLPGGVYAAIIEKGTEAAFSSSDTSTYVTFAYPFPTVAQGATEFSLTADAAKIDRTKSYEVLLWKIHTSPAVSSNIYARADIELTSAQWNAIFPVVVPSVEIVGSVTDLDPEASNVVTVRGSGFVPDAPATTGTRPPLAGKFTGVYVAFGSYAEVWQPSTGAAAATRVGLDVKWAVPAESAETIGGAGSGAIVLAADGTFETTLTLSANESKALVDGSYGVVTYPGGGAKYAPFETFTAVTFAEEGGTDLSVSLDLITPRESLTLSIATSALPTDITGAYVGVFEKPAVGSAYIAMDADASVSAGVLNTVLQVSASKLDRTKTYEVVVWKKRSSLDGNEYVRADLVLTPTQWDELLGSGNNGGGDTGGNPGGNTGGGSTPPVVTPTMGAGSLTWGISSSFSNYVTGNIAKGRISTSGVGAGYLFPQSSASSWNTATQTGTVQYSGSVNFTGHAGVLDLTVSNPVITVTSATTGTISAGVASGTLNLAAATKTVGANGEVTWSNVPVSGAITGGSGGSGGSSALDNLTFTVGAASGANFGSTTVVSPSSQTRTEASTPPATSGITVITPEEELVPGGEIEFEAEGFESNERNILVVLYSDPIVLDRNAGADANGKVRWIGTLPEDIEPGEHTITLQGSINVGKVITVISAADAEKKAELAKSIKAVAESGEAAEVQAAGVASGDGVPGWAIWVGALALLVVAGGLTGLVVAQRRRNESL